MWFDLDKAEEAALIEELALRKQHYQYTASIRDGLRLLFSLQEGCTDVLFELFPELEARLSNGDDDSGNGELKEWRDMIESVVLAKGSEMVLAPLPEADVEVDSAASAVDLIEEVDESLSAEEIGRNYMEQYGNLFN